MYIPSLEATQGLFLMSIAEWGKGDKHRSSMHMGIAVTMAGILRLHREETYQLSETGTAEEFVHAEAARRTFWMLESYNSLLSGSSSPVSISYRDISALLPCSEAEFAFGSTTGPRAAMAGTLPTLANPALVHCPSRSLFATLLQTHSLWGRVARFVGRDDENFLQNWQVRRDEYMEVLTALNEFESNIPPLQRWSTWNLRGFKAEGLDLAYFSAVMALRLSYIVLGRRYLHDQNQSNGIPCTGEQSTITTADLFQNMLVLHEQIDAFFDFRLTDQGFPALIVFCIYVCGSLANHLHQEPHIFPSIAPRAEEILRKSLTGLGQLQDAWPLARKWNSSLCRATATARIPMHRVIDTIQDGRGSDNTNDLLLPLDSDALPDNTSPGDVVRLNDPFPSDVMLLEFETYPWNDIFTGMADPPLSNIL
ncbi:hypothetical protein BDW74DRAFT_147215 [Aspergillus multicolor]|uniref:fungal specific transcription factor domain-containing protein n=1 Tax=Aspergillus multicolor TaxID=41759 RepID=UPI003CCCC302